MLGIKRKTKKQPVTATNEPTRRYLKPSSIWRVTPTMLIEDYRWTEIGRICDEMYDKKLLNQCLLWKNGRPTYIFKEDAEGNINPFPFPAPEQIVTTSGDLYAKAVTYVKTWIRLLKRELQPNKDRFTQASKMIWVGGLIFTVLFMVFVLTVAVIDQPESESINGVQSSGNQADLTLPAPEPTPELPRGVKQ